MSNNQQSTKIASLAKQYGRQVFQTAYRLLGETHLAEDVTQEVFLKLFKKTTKAFDRILNWPAYLKTMATSTAFDLLRKRKVRAEEPLDGVELSNISDLAGNQPSELLATSRDLKTLQFALTKLSPQEAQVFALRFLEEFSYQEISQQLDISNSLVGVTLHRAQKKLLELVSQSDLLGVNYETTI